MHFLSQCAVQFPLLFQATVGGLGLLNPEYGAVPSSAMLCDVAMMLHSKRLLGAPVVDASTNKVIGKTLHSITALSADPTSALPQAFTIRPTSRS